MSHKNLDKHGRFRSMTIAFRISPQERDAIKRMAVLTGLNYQDYLIANATRNEIKVYGNPRVFIALKRELERLTQEIERVKEGSEISPEMEGILRFALSILARMKEGSI